MAASPDFVAVASDCLWCLGLGVAVGALRDAMGLLAGNGRARCFLWDLLAFALAAVLLCGFSAARSATGVTRWYMAVSLGAGALAWRRTFSMVLYMAADAFRRFCIWPFSMLARYCLQPLCRYIGIKMKSLLALHHEMTKTHGKKVKNTKKQLQNPRRILYN